MWRSKIFENFPVVLLSGSEILGVSIWRPKIFENFTAALMSGSEILLSAHGRIPGAHDLNQEWESPQHGGHLLFAEG